MKRHKLILFFVFCTSLLLLIACGKSTEQAGETSPAPSSPGQGKCGDGICDEQEQKNPSLCPEDCSGNGTPSVEPPPEPGPIGACGDSICDKHENPENCPQDCSLVSDVEEPQTQSGSAKVQPLWRSTLGACPPANQVDDWFAEFEFTWIVNEEGMITGFGEGTMYTQGVARCEGQYGGARTPDPFPVSVAGMVVETGYKIDLQANDLTQFYFTTGEVYHEECVLCWILPWFEGQDISGRLSSFTLPSSIHVGDQFHFEMDHQVQDVSWINYYVGSGILEILSLTP
jgi:hypothetical protein